VIVEALAIPFTVKVPVDAVIDPPVINEFETSI